MTVDVYILLGGFVSADGFAVSRGLLTLRDMLKELKDVRVFIYNWGAYAEAGKAIKARDLLTLRNRVAVVGYSGGGSRATWLANMINKIKIDLMVLYDPSPRWQMEPIGSNVKQALTYQNPNATLPSFFGMLGGGVLEAQAGGPEIERIITYRNHILVQFDKTLHSITVERIKRLRDENTTGHASAAVS